MWCDVILAQGLDKVCAKPNVKFHLIKVLGLLTASFFQDLIKQIGQLIKVACIVNIASSDFFQLALKILILANSNGYNANIFFLWTGKR